MSTKYTKAELNQFRRLVELAESRNQMDRIKSRFEMPKFIEKHGKEKCDEMFKVLCDEIGMNTKNAASNQFKPNLIRASGEALWTNRKT